MTSTCRAAPHSWSKSTAPGKAEAVVVDARDQLGFTFGLTTCYDVRFPEYVGAGAKSGCDAILVPSAFTVPTGEAHWHLLLRARAVESQCYILAAAQAGAHNEKRRSYGHALAVDPWGVVVGDCGDAAPSLVTVDLDLDKVRRDPGEDADPGPPAARRRGRLRIGRWIIYRRPSAETPFFFPTFVSAMSTLPGPMVHGPLGPGGRPRGGPSSGLGGGGAARPVWDRHRRETLS